MDSAQLIIIVEEYKDLYNLRYPDYYNQQRGDSIWEEIGSWMNQPSKYFYNLFMSLWLYSGILLTK